MRELPFDSQVKYVKGIIKELIKYFKDDQFSTDDIINPPFNHLVVYYGRINLSKVLEYLDGIGEIKITERRRIIHPGWGDSGDYDFKVITDKLGKIPSVNIDVPVSKRIIQKQYFDENLEMMIAAYALLASFENRLRFLIASILKKNFGNDWWKTNVPKKIKDSVNRKKEDNLRGWHVDEPKQEIQFTDFSELKSIITKDENWPLFEEVFGRKDVLENSLTFLEIPRNIIAHSNVLSKEMCTELRFYIKKINNLMDKYESKKRFRLF